MSTKKLLLIIAIIFTNLTLFAQQDTCVESSYVLAKPPLHDTCGYWVGGFILRPVYNCTTGKNTWILIDDADHTPMNMKDTVTTYSDHVDVYFADTAYKIISHVCGLDESTIFATSVESYTCSAPPRYNTGGYKVGVSVGYGKASVYMSKPGRFAYKIIRDSINNTFTQTQVGPNTANLYSTPFQIVPKLPVAGVGYTCIEIRTDSVIEGKDASTYDVVYADGNKKYAVTARHETNGTKITRVWLTKQVADFDSVTKEVTLRTVDIPVSEWPHNTTIMVNYGEVDVKINMETERMPGGANIWADIKMKGVRH